MKRVLTSTLTALLCVALATPALAENPKVNVQVFRPAAHDNDLFTVMSSDVGENLRWSVGVWGNYGKNALVFVERGATDRRHEVIQDRLTLDITGQISFAEFVSVGLALPLHVMNSGESGFLTGTTSGLLDTDAIESFAIGDLRLSPKFAIVNRKDDDDGFGLALEIGATIPTGDAESFVTDGFNIQPTVIIDFKSGPFMLALNGGYRMRMDDNAFLPFDVEVGNELIWKVGAGFDLIEDQLTVIGEVYGASADFTVANNTHLEGVIGGRLSLPDSGLAFNVGGGSGFTTGYGNTKFRVFAGATLSPPVITDQDMDGFVDDVDKCPLEPEDTDGFEDDDGCPEDDNDGDGVLDAADKCPADPEDKDSFEDEDGCPDPDNDGDGVADADDRCVMEAEDKDNFEDADGCPDPDNDGDGFLDGVDKCPLEKETVNGHEDDDGCPDKSLAKVEAGKIVILEKIFFDTGKATIKPESMAVVQAVAGVLKVNPQIKSITIEGHTDDVGSAKKNKKLSQERADAVRAAIIALNIAEGRMTAVGFGEEKPLMLEKTDESRAANRRVEFNINE